jgi:hypothetical protein
MLEFKNKKKKKETYLQRKLVARYLNYRFTIYFLKNSYFTQKVSLKIFKLNEDKSRILCFKEEEITLSLAKYLSEDFVKRIEVTNP